LIFYFIEYQFGVIPTKEYFVYFHVSFGVMAGFHLILRKPISKCFCNEKSKTLHPACAPANDGRCDNAGARDSQ
jgi:hypothetical protein